MINAKVMQKLKEHDFLNLSLCVPSFHRPPPTPSRAPFTPLVGVDEPCTVFLSDIILKRVRQCNNKLISPQMLACTILIINSRCNTYKMFKQAIWF